MLSERDYMRSDYRQNDRWRPRAKLRTMQNRWSTMRTWQILRIVMLICLLSLGLWGGLTIAKIVIAWMIEHWFWSIVIGWFIGAGIVASIGERFSKSVNINIRI